MTIQELLFSNAKDVVGKKLELTIKSCKIKKNGNAIVRFEEIPNRLTVEVTPKEENA